MGAPRPVLELLLAAVPLTGCADPRPEIRAFRGAAMGTTYEIKYVGPQKISKVRAAVEAELTAFSAIFSTWIPDSEISRFNAHPPGTDFAASSSLREVVGEALRIAELTDGAFDPTVGPLLRAYGFGPGGEPEGDPQNALERVGWQKVTVTANGLRKSTKGVELDLNAIAKGAGVDRVAALLTERGIDSFMVEIGGEVFCSGEKAPGQPWIIAVEDPTDRGAPAVTMPLSDLAMATSGTYRNFRKAGDRRVHHILDPRSGRNAENRVVSVSVIAPSCMLADALATAFMVLGPDAAGGVIQSQPGVRALFQLGGEDGALQRLEFGW